MQLIIIVLLGIYKSDLYSLWTDKVIKLLKSVRENGKSIYLEQVIQLAEHFLLTRFESADLPWFLSTVTIHSLDSFVHMTFWALGMWLWLLTIFFIPIRTHYFKDNSDQGNSMSSHSYYINLTNERWSRIFVIEMNSFPLHLKIRKFGEIYHYLHS